MGQNKLAMSLLAGCLIAGAVSTEAIADETNFDKTNIDVVVRIANMAKLPMPAVEALQGLDMNVAVPTAIPDGFFLQKIELEFNDWGGTTYSLIYKDTNGPVDKTCFAIEGASIAEGLPVGEKSYPFYSPEFGASTLEMGDFGESPRISLLGQWMVGRNGSYRFLGAGISESLVGCDNISVEEAIAVSESIQYLP